MGKTARPHTSDEEPPAKRGRQAGAKTYKKPTLYKIIAQWKPTSMLQWQTVAEQYRQQCGELETRPAATIKKFFFQKMCNSGRKPTGSSGLDDLTQKCQALHRALFQKEEGDAFGDSDEDNEDPVPAEQAEDTSDSGSDVSEALEYHHPSIGPTPTPPTTETTSSTPRPIVIVKPGHSDTKSKNAKPNPTTRLNVGKSISQIAEAVSSTKKDTEMNVLIYLEAERMRAEERERVRLMEREEAMLLRQQEKEEAMRLRQEERETERRREERFQLQLQQQQMNMMMFLYPRPGIAPRTFHTPMTQNSSQESEDVIEGFDGNDIIEAELIKKTTTKTYEL